MAACPLGNTGLLSHVRLPSTTRVGVLGEVSTFKKPCAPRLSRAGRSLWARRKCCPQEGAPLGLSSWPLATGLFLGVLQALCQGDPVGAWPLPRPQCCVPRAGGLRWHRQGAGGPLPPLRRGPPCHHLVRQVLGTPQGVSAGPGQGRGNSRARWAEDWALTVPLLPSAMPT